MLLEEGGTVKVALGAVVLVEQSHVISDSLLVVLEENVVFDFEVLGLGEFEAGHTEVVFETGDLHFVAVDLPYIELDIVACGGVGVELSVCLMEGVKGVFVVGVA